MCFFNLKKKDLSHVFEKDCQILSPKGSEEWISDTLEKYLRIGSTNTLILPVVVYEYIGQKAILKLKLSPS